MPSSEYTPTVAEVAALLRARAVDSDGNELSSFTPSTRPTDAQVSSLITRAAETVSMVVGADIDAALFEEAKSLVSLRAAMLVELSFFPEQVRDDRSAYTHYKTLWDEDLERLKLAVQEAGAGDEPGSVDDSAGPIFSFPEDVGGMVGWGTEW